MRGRKYLRVAAAAVAAFVASLAWYMVFGGAMAELSNADLSTAADTTSPVWATLFVVAQSLVVASVLAFFVSRLDIADRRAALRLGALVWIFPASILLGSVVHENVPPALAAIHAGDWLVKLLLISVLLGTWRKGASAGAVASSPARGELRSRPMKAMSR